MVRGHLEGREGRRSVFDCRGVLRSRQVHVGAVRQRESDVQVFELRERAMLKRIKTIYKGTYPIGIIEQSRILPPTMYPPTT